MLTTLVLPGCWEMGSEAEGYRMDDGGQLSTVPTASMTGRVALGSIGAISGGRMQAPVTQPDTTYPGRSRTQGFCDAGQAFQETAWKGTLKTVVQRPSPWLTLRLPPRASTRRRAPSRPRPEEKAS